MKSTNLEQIFYRYKERFLYWEEYEVDIQHASDITIIIPAYYEQGLSVTLRSLNNCHPVDPIPTVIVVLNHPASAPEKVREFHLHQYAKLLKQEKELKTIHLVVIKAFELKPNQTGVGAARKIGMDLALRDFGRKGRNGLMACLDGDCLVENTYLEALQAAANEDILTAIAPYEHREDCGAELSRGIQYYELYLRAYKAGLGWTGFPFPYDTIGSCMAVRASLYAQVGGMNRRKAGEDFYFLHKCFPHGKVKELKSGKVYPSSRISERVPFGTGKAQKDWAVSRRYQDSYHPDSWKTIKEFLEKIPRYWEDDGFKEIPRDILPFLKEVNFRNKISEIKSKSNRFPVFKKHFYAWCDGFMIMKLLHHLRDHVHGQEKLVITAQKLLMENCAVETTVEVENLLQIYRRIDNDCI